MPEYLPGVPAAMNREVYNQFLTAFRSALPNIGNTIEDVIAGGRIAEFWQHDNMLSLFQQLGSVPAPEQG